MYAIVRGVADLIGVLAAAALLGAEVWIVGILVLGYVVSRPALGAALLARTVAMLAASAAVYVATVILIGLMLAP